MAKQTYGYIVQELYEDKWMTYHHEDEVFLSREAARYYKRAAERTGAEKARIVRLVLDAVVR